MRREAIPRQHGCVGVRRVQVLDDEGADVVYEGVAGRRERRATNLEATVARLLYHGVARVTDSVAERSTVGEVVASKPVHPVDTAVI